MTNIRYGLSTRFLYAFRKEQIQSLTQDSKVLKFEANTSFLSMNDKTHQTRKSASFVLTYSRNDPACVPNQSVGLNHSNVNFNLIRNVSICSLRLKPSWSLNFMGSSSFLRSNNSIQFHTKNRRESKSAENSHVAPAGVSGRRL